jgi:phosphate:Na+ symporter
VGASRDCQWQNRLVKPGSLLDISEPYKMRAILEILGGLGVFLFGLRVMSNGLQSLAGKRLRAVMNALTHNRVTGIFSGFLITVAVQSSSATTVLIVSFANAGLLTLIQAIGLVMGANIGTTITAWMVSLLGFKIDIASFALPAIGLGFPLSLMHNPRARQLSEVLVGFGLLFLGLMFLKDGVPDLKNNPEALEWLQQFTHYGFGSVVLFVIVGALLTIVVQSSSASTTITLTMAAKGWIGFDMAAAMILGENIGTTITATLAALGANRTAKRVARSHTLFNLIGILWMLPLMGVFLGVIDAIIPGDPYVDALAAPTHLAAFHTVFNVTNTLLMVWFVKQIAWLVHRLIPPSDDEKEAGHLQFLEAGLVSTPELAGMEARRALQTMTGVCQNMFKQIEEVIGHPDMKLGELVDKIKRGEIKTDEMEEEIVAFCSELARAATSQSLGRDVTLYLEMANDIERMGDHCFNLVLLAERRYEKAYHFDEIAQKDLAEMMDLVAQLLVIVHDTLDPDTKSRLDDARLIEAKINKLRDRTRKRHAKRMQQGEVGIREGLIYLDMMTNMEKLGDYCMNVAQATEGLRGPTAE